MSRDLDCLLYVQRVALGPCFLKELQQSLKIANELVGHASSHGQVTLSHQLVPIFWRCATFAGAVMSLAVSPRQAF
jgi:hypothetical protein